MNNISKDIKLGANVIIEDNVNIGKNCYIDSNTIIRSGVTIGDNTFIGSNCIIGEYQMDFCLDRISHNHPLTIGSNAIIRSGTILYSGSRIGNNFQTGHHVTIREETKIGNDVSVGTLSDIQGCCCIGNNVRFHSNVHIGQKSVIDDFVWIFPYVVLTNDPTPPSADLLGVHIKSFAIIATRSVLLPGVVIGQDALVAAGSVVTKNVASYAVVMGNPAKQKLDVREIKNKITGKNAYPWRHKYSNRMPWSESDFNTWYSQLSLEEKVDRKIDKIEQ